MTDRRKHSSKHNQNTKNAFSNRIITPESLKCRVKNEGITARNLIKFNVPMTNTRKHTQSEHCNSNTDVESICSNSYPDVTHKDLSKPTLSSPPSAVPLDPSDSMNTSMCNQSVATNSLISQVMAPNSDYRARYWGQMMSTLKRTVDEIYSACEADQSEMECREVIMILEHSIKDFRSLIEKMNLFREYEEADVQKRPTSLAWDERKTSGGKPIMKQVLQRRRKSHTQQLPQDCSLKNEAGDTLVSSLSVSSTSIPPPVNGVQSGPKLSSVPSFTWADKVRGILPSPSETHISPLRPLVIEQIDIEKHPVSSVETEDDGWETVTRQRVKSKSTSRPPSVHRQVVSPAIPNQSSHLGAMQERVEGVPFQLSRRQSRSESNLVDSIASYNQCVDLKLCDADKLIGDAKLPISSTKAIEEPQLLSSTKDSDIVLDLASSPPQNAKLEGSLERQELDKSNLSLNSIELLSEEEDFTQNLNKINMELESLVTAESELTCELGRAQEEEAHFRRQVEEECQVDEEGEEENEVAPPSLSSLERYQGISWAELDAMEDEIDEIETLRTPGRGFQMDKRLSSPSRKKPANSIQKLEEKQAKARDLRERHLSERSDRVRELTKKVEEVCSHKQFLLNLQKDCMSERLRRAEVKRQAQLERRVRKAHDEETKGKEIAFIQLLEAAQKQHTIQTKHMESEARLMERQEERKRKAEEKLEKEAAAEERRRNMEATRLAWVREIKERWRSREQHVSSQAELKEQSRVAAARAKEQERENKMAAKKAGEMEHIIQLKNKIQKKHMESERRYQEQLREISRKAFEMSIRKHSNDDECEAPPIDPYIEKKWCNACNVMIDSEVFLQSHLRGKKHQNALKELTQNRILAREEVELFNLKHIVDAPTDKPDPKIQASKERRKSMKKRIKKIKQRMINRGIEFDKALEKAAIKVPDSYNKPKFMKFVKEVRRYISINDSGPWVTPRVAALDKSLNEVLRTLDKRGDIKSKHELEQDRKGFQKFQEDQFSAVHLGCISTVVNVLALIEQQKENHPTILPDKSFVLACQVIQTCCYRNQDSSTLLLLSNSAGVLVNLLSTRLSILIPDDFGLQTSEKQMAQSSLIGSLDYELPVDSVASALMDTIGCILEGLFSIREKPADSLIQPLPVQMDYQRAQDVVSLIVSLGIVDRLSDYLTQVRGPLAENSPTALFVLSALSFLACLLKLLANTKRVEGCTTIGLYNGDKEGYRTPHGDKESLDTLSRGPGLSAQEDPTQLLAAIHATELCGLICLLYGLLLYTTRSLDCGDDIVTGATGQVTLVGLRMINCLAAIHLQTMQTVLSEEGISLQLRHILSFLLSHCIMQYHKEHMDTIQHHNGSNNSAVSFASNTADLLHEVVLSVGYFTVLNRDNQNFVQSGQRPTILQQLCHLPFDYFSQRDLSGILFPTLVTACLHNPENTMILEQEMSTSLLADFIAEKISERGTNSRKNSKSSFSNESFVKEENQEARFHFANRFPKDMWEEAKVYFSDK